MFRRLPLLFVLILYSVGVTHAFTVRHHGNGVVQPPIITPSQQLRICAELCRSGLGGAPCGDVCYDLLPKAIPVQLPAESTATGGGRTGDTAVTRAAACPVLCKHRLGYPFCQCAVDDKQLHVAGAKLASGDTTAGGQHYWKWPTTPATPPGTATSTAGTAEDGAGFTEICEHYCLNENWVLRGCPACQNPLAQHEHLSSLFRQDGGGAHLARMVQIPGAAVRSGSDIDWSKWCHVQCANANGGSACNCDILPFSLQIH